MLECRLIISPPSPAAWNMAVDESLLMDAAESGVGSLRFYEWTDPTLSLGYFQRYDDRQTHAASRACSIVRRQTGGGAILHDRELTYSIALPSVHPMTRTAQKLYTVVHDGFIAVLTQLSSCGCISGVLVRNDRGSNRPAAEEPFMCFARRATGDVLLASKGDSRDPGSEGMWPAGAKIIGSAQRRHHGAILQHGSLLLEKSPYAPELAGWCDLTGIQPPIEELIHSLSAQLENELEVRLIPVGMPHDLESNALTLTKSKYGIAAWTKRR
jgi:lipoate-protein ligase A